MERRGEAPVARPRAWFANAAADDEADSCADCRDERGEGGRVRGEADRGTVKMVWKNPSGALGETFFARSPQTPRCRLEGRPPPGRPAPRCHKRFAGHVMRGVVSWPRGGSLLSRQ